MANLFTIILFLWSMVALFVVAQLIIMLFTPYDDVPSVFTWRRK